MKSSLWNAMACVGSVVGAGFASGREIMVFFTQYGKHSWWLIGWAAGLMAWICSLSVRHAQDGGWCRMVSGRLEQSCTLLLLFITGGAMVSAAGQMIALVWVNQQAYWLAAAGTLMLAWVVGNTRVLGCLGSGLSVLLVCVLLVVRLHLPSVCAAVQLQPVKQTGLRAVVHAAGYAAMNMTLAIGVVSRCPKKRGVPWLFGLSIAGLMGVSNALYLQHPEMMQEPFPIVRLLAAFGRMGFVTSVCLLYLAIFTTLVSVVGTVRTALESWFHKRLQVVGLSLLPMLCLSAAGFSGIVERMYAPAGLLCFTLIFVPLFRNRDQEKLDKAAFDTVR